MTLDPKEVGRRIAAARDAKGWTQLAFALAADVSPSTIQRWEGGKLPPVRELLRIADLLELEADLLVTPVAGTDGASISSRLAEIERQQNTTRGILEEILRRLPEPHDQPREGTSQSHPR